MLAACCMYHLPCQIPWLTYCPDKQVLSPIHAELLPGCLPFAGSSGHIEATLSRPAVVSELALLSAENALPPHTGGRACSPPQELDLQGKSSWLLAFCCVQRMPEQQ